MPVGYSSAISHSVVTRFAALIAVVVVAASCSDDDDNRADVIDVGSGAVGTCLDFDADTGAEVTELPTIDCAEPHSHEIFAVVVSDETVYPGFEALESTAQAKCLGQFEEYVGISAFDSTLFYSWLVPTLTSWDREDDREIICVVGDGAGAPLVGSVRGSDR